jgi:hypothetical protein
VLPHPLCAPHGHQGRQTWPWLGLRCPAWPFAAAQPQLLVSLSQCTLGPNTEIGVRWGRGSNGSVEHGSMVQDVHFFNHLAARRSTSERAKACATTSAETCARSTRTPVILFGSCVSTCVCMKAAHLVTEPRMVCVSGCCACIDGVVPHAAPLRVVWSPPRASACERRAR